MRLNMLNYVCMCVCYSDSMPLSNVSLLNEGNLTTKITYQINIIHTDYYKGFWILETFLRN